MRVFISMRTRGRLRLAAVSAAVALMGAPHAALDAQAQSLESIVTRASAYATAFVTRFSHVVAEERYQQNLTVNGRLATGRELVADVLLVQIGDTAGLTVFRDVFEVNHIAQRDHDERLTRLFMESPASAAAQAAAITKESARFNLGISRTVNNPFLAMAFLQDQYRSRFQFSLIGQERIDGTNVDVIGYQETGQPTLIKGPGEGDLPVRGRYWIDPQDGSIVKAELVTLDAAQRAKITVAFRSDDRFHLRVPRQMDEEYALRTGTTLKATAKYDRFRQFEVKTEERVR